MNNIYGRLLKQLSTEKDIAKIERILTEYTIKQEAVNIQIPFGELDIQNIDKQRVAYNKRADYFIKKIEEKKDDPKNRGIYEMLLGEVNKSIEDIQKKKEAVRNNIKNVPIR